MNNVELNAMQSRFVDEYLSDPDRNATKAACRAGYSVATAGKQGSSLLKRPHIKAAIEARMGKAADIVGITEIRILQELAKIGFSNLADFAAMTEDGMSIRDIPREHSAALKELTFEETSNGKFTTKRSKISIADKRQALIDMGKHLGMFKEKVEHSGTFNFLKMVEDSMTDVDVIDVESIEVPQIEELE